MGAIESSGRGRARPGSVQYRRPESTEQLSGQFWPLGQDVPDGPGLTKLTGACRPGPPFLLFPPALQSTGERLASFPGHQPAARLQRRAVPAETSALVQGSSNGHDAK